jgi:hypothetical protein
MDRTLTVVADNKKIKHYNPEKGLKEIAVAEAAERHWKRAKDAEQLCTAIDRKIDAQADYVEWRDGVVVPSQKAGIGRGVDKPVVGRSANAFCLPGLHAGQRIFLVDTTRLSSFGTATLTFPHALLLPANSSPLRWRDVDRFDGGDAEQCPLDVEKAQVLSQRLG